MHLTSPPSWLEALIPDVVVEICSYLSVAELQILTVCLCKHIASKQRVRFLYLSSLLVPSSL